LRHGWQKSAHFYGYNDRMTRSHHAGADFPPGSDNALSKLANGQPCILILPDGRQCEASWSTASYRFVITGAAGPGQVSADDVDEWWAIKD
jgi:hypothetical protein